jgi:hypothetical protein
MAHPDRDGLRRLQEALGAVSEFLEVHAILSGSMMSAM